MRMTAALLALTILAGCGATPQEEAERARAAFAAHDYAKARLHALAALQDGPADRELQMIQARSALALGDGEGAGVLIARIAGGKPSGELAELAAEAALLRRKPAEALGFLTDMTGAEAERLRGLAALQAEDADAARKHFEAAVAAGGNARAHADLARFRMMRGDATGAQEQAVAATRLDPRGIDTLLVIAQLAAMRGDAARALATYREARKAYPDNFAALVGEGAMLGELGRIDELEKVAAQASAAAPRNPEALWLTARAAAGRKDWEKVRSLVQPVEGGIDAVHPLRLLYAQALAALGQPGQAAAQLNPIVLRQPGNRLAVRLLAQARLAMRDPKGAMEVLRRVADDPMANPQELALMAKAAEAAGSPLAAGYRDRMRDGAARSLGADLAEANAAVKAANWARAALAYDRILAQTDGGNVMVLNNMAYAQSMLGNHAKAVEFADRALKLAPDNASVLDTAGWVRLRGGTDIAAAKKLIGRAAELAPGNETIRSHLAEARRKPG